AAIPKMAGVGGFPRGGPTTKAAVARGLRRWSAKGVRPLKDPCSLPHLGPGETRSPEVFGLTPGRPGERAPGSGLLAALSKQRILEPPTKRIVAGGHAHGPVMRSERLIVLALGGQGGPEAGPDLG